AGHRTLIPEMIEALKDMGRADIKVVAGGVIPPQDYAALRAAGVQAIFGPGTNLADAADEVLRLLGHNRPPLDEAAEGLLYWRSRCLQRSRPNLTNISKPALRPRLLRPNDRWICSIS